MKLTMEEHGEVIRHDLIQGLTYREIAKTLGCSHHTVSIFAAVNFPELRRKPVKALTVAPRTDDNPGMKVLIIDIETRPNEFYDWSLYGEKHIGAAQIIETTSVICFAAKWLNDPVVHFKSVFHNTQLDMVQHAWNLLDQADAVMHYNGTRFDVPHLNREFLMAGLTPPSPFKQIDLLSTVRRTFKFPQNKLAHVSEALGLEGKVEHEGFPLWLKCLADDADAWERMKEYNIRDVTLLEDLYAKLLPWIERHPSFGAFTGENVCRNCGSSDLKRDGFAYTTTGKFQQYVCGDCGKYLRDTKRCDHTQITEVAA